MQISSDQADARLAETALADTGLTDTGPAATGPTAGPVTSRWLRLAAVEPRLRPLPGDPREFESWRRAVLAAVRRLAGSEPDDHATAGSALRSAAETDGLIREEHLIGGANGCRVVATYLAGSHQPRPAVVVCPGRNAVVDQVTGAQPPDYPDRNVAEQVARAGFLTVTMDYGLDGLVDPALLRGRDEAVLLAQLLALNGRPLLGVLARDVLRVMSWLGGYPGAAPGRTALFGHSLGGAVALHAALLADRPPPLCVASHLGSYRVLGRGHAAAALPGIARHADLPDLFAALAPAPLQLQYGTLDAMLEPGDAAAAGQRIAELYGVVGAARQVQVQALPIGHGTGVGPAVDFLRRALAGEHGQGEHGQETGPAARSPVLPIRVSFSARMREQIVDTVQDVLDSGTLTMGPTVARFERELQARIGQPAVTVDSGSSALEIALRDIDVAGRLVLAPVNTFIATAAAAVRAGARVDFVDLEPAGLGLSEESLRERLDAGGDAVAAVIVMHTGGIVAPMLCQTLATCHARGIPVIEDAAHAFGSSLDGRPAGAIADCGAYSFYPTKVLTCGEGGAVTAARASSLEVFRRLRDHGRTAPGATTHDCLGSNWRLSELHAAVGLAQLQAFTDRTAARARLAARYDELLSGVPGLTIQPVPPGVSTSWYKYIVHLADGVDRAALKTRLREDYAVLLAGEVYDLPLHAQPYFAADFAGRTFPHAERFARAHICLPLYPELTPGEQDRVVEALRQELR